MDEKAFSFDDIIAKGAAKSADVTSRNETDEDVVLNISLRPAALEEFIG